jgi:hypothetical protein
LTCYDFWADTLMNGYRDAKPLIDFIRTRPKNELTYCELDLLFLRWSAVVQKANARAGV